MKYRILPHTGQQVSILGMGSSYVGAQPEKDIIRTVQAACEAGINYFDLAAGHASVFPAYGKALEGCRDKVLLQVHFGADYTTGEYGWTTCLGKVKTAVSWQLQNLKTDYIDIGFIHCLDEEDDLNAYEENGVLDYLLSLKAGGVIHSIGFSTHNPAMANRMLDRGILDVLMFSINPAYDYQQGTYANGSGAERLSMYRRCEAMGVGISVMKPYSGGQLLDASKSPFRKALTPFQCIRYALDRPGVMTVLPGCANVQQLQSTLKYLEASEEETDYSVLGEFTPSESVGRCVYCKHCHPCPKGLDIALINKYYDLSQLGDDMARQHYLNLSLHASDCVSCGHCDKRCPFHVHQSERMKEIAACFGI